MLRPGFLFYGEWKPQKVDIRDKFLSKTVLVCHLKHKLQNQIQMVLMATNLLFKFELNTSRIWLFDKLKRVNLKLLNNFD